MSNLKEGIAKEVGHSLHEGMMMETAGQMGAEGMGKHNFKEGGHKKGGGRIHLGSDRSHPKKAMKKRRT